MKFYKFLLLGSALMFASGCGNASNLGQQLTVDNAATYIEPLVENQGNASFSATQKTVTFHLYPNTNQNKLFASDIKGKCTVKAKFGTGLFPIEWSEPEEYVNVAFEFKEGGTGESGYKQADYLEAIFTYAHDYDFGLVNVYDLRVTEISGHMAA